MTTATLNAILSAAKAEDLTVTVTDVLGGSGSLTGRVSRVYPVSTRVVLVLAEGVEVSVGFDCIDRVTVAAH